MVSWSRDFERGGTGLMALSHWTASKKAAVQNRIDVQIGWTLKWVYKYSRYGSKPGTSTETSKRAKRMVVNVVENWKFQKLQKLN